MRILHIEEMFHPFIGYQINVLPKFQAQQGHEVAILSLHGYYPRVAAVYDNSKIDEYDRRYTEETGVRIYREKIKRLLFRRPLFDKRVIDRIREYDPDIIMCHGNGVFICIQILLWRNRIKKPLIFDSHMLELAHRSKFHNLYARLYRLFIKPIIVRNHFYVIKTADDPYLNVSHGIPEPLTPYLGFGADVSLFFPDADVKRQMREKYGIADDERVFLYTGKVSAEKGGELLAKALLKKFPEEGGKKPVFVIVASYRSQYEVMVREMLKASENRIIQLPLQKYPDLPAFYQFADVMFFPKQCSLSFFDAQACGVPVILEDININRDRVVYGNGCTFESGSVNGLRARIEEYLNMDEDALRELSENSCRLIREKYSYEEIAQRYTEQMEKAIAEYNAAHSKKKSKRGSRETA